MKASRFLLLFFLQTICWPRMLQRKGYRLPRRFPCKQVPAASGLIGCGLQQCRWNWHVIVMYAPTNGGAHRRRSGWRDVMCARGVWRTSRVEKDGNVTVTVTVMEPSASVARDISHRRSYADVKLDFTVIHRVQKPATATVANTEIHVYRLSLV